MYIRLCQRPYHVDNTGSRLIAAVKQRWAWLVLGWVTGHAVAQLVEALRYKSEGRGFYSRWCYWNFSLI